MTVVSPQSVLQDVFVTQANIESGNNFDQR